MKPEVKSVRKSCLSVGYVKSQAGFTGATRCEEGSISTIKVLGAVSVTAKATPGWPDRKVSLAIYPKSS